MRKPSTFLPLPTMGKYSRLSPVVIRGISKLMTKLLSQNFYNSKSRFLDDQVGYTPVMRRLFIVYLELFALVFSCPFGELLAGHTAGVHLVVLVGMHQHFFTRFKQFGSQTRVLYEFMDERMLQSFELLYNI